MRAQIPQHTIAKLLCVSFPIAFFSFKIKEESRRFYPPLVWNPNAAADYFEGKKSAIAPESRMWNFSDIWWPRLFSEFSKSV